MDIERPDAFVYHDVEFLSNYDGDTVRVKVTKGYDAGFGRNVLCVHQKLTLRLHGVDTYELRSKVEEEKAKGYEAKEYVNKTLTEYVGRITLVTIKDKTGKYGRYLAQLYLREKAGDRDLSKMTYLNQVLIDKGWTTGRFE